MCQVLQVCEFLFDVQHVGIVVHAINSVLVEFSNVSVNVLRLVKLAQIVVRLRHVPEEHLALREFRAECDERVETFLVLLHLEL